MNALPLPELALDLELRLMADQHVLDDGEPQAGAAGRARAAAIDAIEALGQPRNVLRRDADAGIGDAELAAAVASRASRARCCPPPGV